MDKLLPVWVLCLAIRLTDAACTWPDPLANAVWEDSGHGDLDFGSTDMAGWDFTVLSQTLDSWRCVTTDQFTSHGYIVMVTTTTFNAFQSNWYAYLCMKLTKITEVSYMYYQMSAIQDSRGGYERLYIDTSNSITDITTLCSEAMGATGPEYQVIIKSRREAAAKQTCGGPILGTFDYVHTAADGTVTCDTSDDVWDVCTDRQVMTFNYTTCPTKITYSASGTVWCVASVSSEDGTAVYITTYNHLDAGATLDNVHTYRFSCLAVNAEGTMASVAARHCRKDQTPGDIPHDNASPANTVGATLTMPTTYARCPLEGGDEESGSTSNAGGNAGAIAGGVIGGLVCVALLGVVGVLGYRYWTAANKGRAGADKTDTTSHTGGVTSRSVTVSVDVEKATNGHALVESAEELHKTQKDSEHKCIRPHEEPTRAIPASATLQKAIHEQQRNINVMHETAVPSTKTVPQPTSYDNSPRHTQKPATEDLLAPSIYTTHRVQDEFSENTDNASWFAPPPNMDHKHIQKQTENVLAPEIYPTHVEQDGWSEYNGNAHWLAPPPNMDLVNNTKLPIEQIPVPPRIIPAVNEADSGRSDSLNVEPEFANNMYDSMLVYVNGELTVLDDEIAKMGRDQQINDDNVLMPPGFADNFRKRKKQLTSDTIHTNRSPSPQYITETLDDTEKYQTTSMDETYGQRNTELNSVTTLNLTVRLPIAGTDETDETDVRNEDFENIIEPDTDRAKEHVNVKIDSFVAPLPVTISRGPTSTSLIPPNMTATDAHIIGQSKNNMATKLQPENTDSGISSPIPIRNTPMTQYAQMYADQKGKLSCEITSEYVSTIVEEGGHREVAPNTSVSRRPQSADLLRSKTETVVRQRPHSDFTRRQPYPGTSGYYDLTRSGGFTNRDTTIADIVKFSTTFASGQSLSGKSILVRESREMYNLRMDERNERYKEKEREMRDDIQALGAWTMQNRSGGSAHSRFTSQSRYMTDAFTVAKK